MSDKPKGLDQLNANDQAIFDYLDDMFREPDKVQANDLGARDSLKPKITLNQSVSARKPPGVKVVTPESAKPERLHINPKVMTLRSFKEKPPQSLIPDPIIVPMPANELLYPDEALELPVESKSECKSEVKPEARAKPENKPCVVETAIKSALVDPELANVEPSSVRVEVVSYEAEQKDQNVDSRNIEEEGQQPLTLQLPPVTEGWAQNGRPDWAQEHFESLIFRVGGLKLAVPLVTLGAIYQIDRKFNHLPGQADWFIGILRVPSQNIKVIDTALCVMPERYKPEDRENLKFVISLHGYEWGLSCHEVLNSITLDPESVQWRTQRGRRPWLAGTVVDHMCALIDTSGFHSVIERAEKKPPGY